MNLEVLPRRDGQGTLMTVVINHDKTAAEYDVAVDPAMVVKGATAWEMLTETEIEKDTDGRFKLEVPAWGVRVFMIGTPDALKPIREAQAKLNKRDMSVPKYFVDRPELNTYESHMRVPPMEE